MQKFLAFWRKDVINKLIVLQLFLLFSGLFGLGVIVYKMPEGKSVIGMFVNIFPSPTMDPKAAMTRAAEKAIIQIYLATASAPPTITTAPLAEIVKTFTPEPSANPGQLTQQAIPTATEKIIPTATVEKPTAPVAPSLTPTPQPPTPTQMANLPIATASVTLKAPVGNSNSIACIPSNTPEKGVVLDVVDATNIKVLIDGFAYIVHYIGIQAPANKNFATLALNTNGSLAFGKEVLLYKDSLDKDPGGAWLRYVKVGDDFLNLILIEKGLATASDSAPNSACAGLLKQAEDNARKNKVGMWLLDSTPTKP